MGTVPASKNHQKAKMENDKEKSKPIREKEVPLFKHSPEYDEYIKFIGRNRRFIQEKVEAQFGKEQRLVPFNDVNTILSEVAASQKLSFSEAVIKNSLAFAMTG